MAGRTPKPSIGDILTSAPWVSLEEHLSHIRERVDRSINTAHDLRNRYRQELLSQQPHLAAQIRRVPDAALRRAEEFFKGGTVAAADGTISPVPLLGGSKIQIGVVIVSNRGDVVDLVTRVFETEIASDAATATEFFTNLRTTRAISNLLSRAIMLFGERRLLIQHPADWRLIHGELIPHELRTGAGRPEQNLPPTFDLINRYIASEQFLAVSEASDDLDILNAAILLEAGEYIVIRSLEDSLTTFLEGDPGTGQSRANFTTADERTFRQFVASAGPQVAVVLVKAGPKPFFVECHTNRVEEAIAMFLTDALWSRGLPSDASAFTVRGFPFHIDLADQVARTLFKGSDFQKFVEARLFELGIEAGVFDIDPRRTRA
jgi:hypothetical protein